MCVCVCVCVNQGATKRSVCVLCVCVTGGGVSPRDRVYMIYTRLYLSNIGFHGHHYSDPCLSGWGEGNL